MYTDDEDNSVKYLSITVLQSLETTRYPKFGSGISTIISFYGITKGGVHYLPKWENTFNSQCIDGQYQEPSGITRKIDGKRYFLTIGKRIGLTSGL